MKRGLPDPWREQFVSRSHTQSIATRLRNPEAEFEGPHPSFLHAPNRIADVAETFILSDKKTCVRIENRVYSTCLGDMRTKTRCDLPLAEVRRLVTKLPCEVAEGTGPVLIFTYRESFFITYVVTEKGNILENGARNSSGGGAVIKHFVDTLRRVGFPHIGILQRTCVNVQGIVNYSFQIALHYLSVNHPTRARYNESPRSVFFQCGDDIIQSEAGEANDCIFEIYQNGTVKCMGAKDVRTVAACFEYLTAEIVKFKLDESTQKLEDHLRQQHQQQKAVPPSRRRATHRNASSNSAAAANASKNSVDLPSPIMRVTPDAAASLLVELASEKPKNPSSDEAPPAKVSSVAPSARPATKHKKAKKAKKSTSENSEVVEPFSQVSVWGIPMGRRAALL